MSSICGMMGSIILVTITLLTMVAHGNAARAHEGILVHDISIMNVSHSRPLHTFSWDLPGRLRLKDGAYYHVWPDLEFNWRVVTGTIVAFVGGSLGCVGGVGGGGIFVPTLTLIVGFDQKSSTALSKCMIMGASVASVWFNFRLTSPIIDYDLALIFQPMLVLGISIGVVFNVIFPNWVVTILLIVLFTGTSIRTFLKGISFWKQETTEKMLDEEGNSVHVPAEAGINNGSYEALEPVELHDLMPQASKALSESHQDQASHDRTFFGFHNCAILILVSKSPGAAAAPLAPPQQPRCAKTDWNSISALLFVWISFLILQILKVPVAASVFLKKAISVLRYRKGGQEEERFISAAYIEWTIPRLCLCAIAGLIAGIVGGLLGLGGGFILGPLFLEFGVPPQVAGATAIFVMLFSSSMSVIEYYLLHRFPIPFALYLFAINAMAGFWAQYVLQKIIKLFGRASLIVFLLSFIILVSALCLGGYGIEDSIIKLENKEYMGFLNLCSS